jgi:hypothetical protein
MDLKEKILVALGLDKETKLGFQAKSDDGTIFVSTAEELEAGVDISVLTEDGTTIPVPAGTYKLDTGESFRVEDEGIVAEVLVSETEEEDTTEEVEAAEDDGKEADVEDWAGMEKRIQNLEDAVADLKRDKEGGDDEVEEMTEEVTEPTTNPKTITTKEVVEFSAEDELENLKAENEKLKTELAESPADAPINTNKFSSERATPTAQDFKRMTKQEKFLYELYK